MRIFKKATGNWAEDMGSALQTLLVLGFGAMILVPILVVVLVLVWVL